MKRKFDIIRVRFIGIVSIICTMLASSCSDDPNMPSDADDNSIMTFVLNQSNGDSHYSAEIVADTIKMRIPYNIDLNGYVADVTVPASSVIIPNPALIKNWNSEQVFRVRSYNGDSKEYLYRVIREEISHDGDIVLNNQQSIDEFINNGTSVINGSLIIGTEESDKEISNFDGLANLKEISGSLIIKNSVKTSDFTGLNHLVKVGGIEIGSEERFSSSEIEMVSFENLKEIKGDFFVCNDKVSYIKLPHLENIDGSIIIQSDRLNNIDVPELKKIDGKLIISKPYDGKSIGDISILEFPKLEEVTDSITILNLTKVREISFPQLKRSGAIHLPCIVGALQKISIPEVETVNGGVTIFGISDAHPQLSVIDAFQKTKEIRGVISINGDFVNLQDFPEFASLTLVGGIDMQSPKISLVAKYNFPNCEFEEFDGIRPYIDIPKECTSFITKEDLSKVDLILRSSATEIRIKKIHNLTFKTAEAGVSKLPTFENIYGDLYIERNARQGVSMPNLKEVGGFVHFAIRIMASELSFPELTEIGGQLIFDGLFNNVSFKSDFSKLRKVGCSSTASYALRGTYSSDNIPYGSLHLKSTNKSFAFPALEEVGGDGITIDTMNPINFPSLKVVKGILCVYNSKAASVSMPKLEELYGLFFIKNSSFADYSIFGKFIDNDQISKDNWNVTACGYNPTYQDMKEGKYKPAE